MAAAVRPVEHLHLAVVHPEDGPLEAQPGIVVHHPAERAAAIKEVEDSYLSAYFAETGMTPRLLDLLLARGAGVEQLAQSAP